MLGATEGPPGALVGEAERKKKYNNKLQNPCIRWLRGEEMPEDPPPPTPLEAGGALRC